MRLLSLQTWVNPFFRPVNEGIKLNELTIKMKMFCTFLGQPEFSKHVEQFHRALNEHYRKGGKDLYDPAAM